MIVTKKKIIIFIVSFLVLLTIISPIAAYLIANINAKSKVADFTKSLQGRCSIKYGDVSYNILNRHLKISDIAVYCLDEKVVSIKEAEFNHIVSGTPIPLNVQVDLKDGLLNSTAKAFGTYSELFSKLGYDNIDFNGRITYTLGKVSKEFKLVTLNINTDGIGLFQGQLKIPDVYDTDIKNIYSNILNNKQSSFNIHFTDTGLKNTVISKYMQLADINNIDINEKIKNAIYKRAVGSDNKTKENYNNLEKFLLINNSISVNLSEQDNKSIAETINAFDISGYRKMLNSIKNTDVELIAK